MSHDWAIDELTIGVTFDSDRDKAKKLMGQVGKKLADDPEFTLHTIETLKMQGAEQFGNFAVQLRLKMTTKSGDPLLIRRLIYVLLEKAFDANGIKFAYPTVQEAGGGEIGAVAGQGLVLIDRAKPDSRALPMVTGRQPRMRQAFYPPMNIRT